MIHSMTAYGRAEQSGDWGRASCEIRAVNHRYLDIALRLPEELRMLEQALRERVSARLKRGKIDCAIRFAAHEAASAALPVNTELLAQLSKTAEQVAAGLQRPAPVNPLELLGWPGILEQKAPDEAAISAPLLELLDQTLDAVTETRRREGEQIKARLMACCQKARERVAGVRRELPAILLRQRQKMAQRLRELDLKPDHDRLEQELVLLAQKLDVTEEMDRLELHLDEVSRVLNRPGPAGRRLDFLMQEMNREANTLGSKSAHINTSNAGVDLKVLIEQMREQIQNVE